MPQKTDQATSLILTVLVGFAPFVLLHLVELLDRPLYRFSPFLIVAVFAMLKPRWVKLRELKGPPVLGVDKPTRKYLAVGLFFAFMSVVLYEPALAWLGFMVATAGLARYLDLQGRLPQALGPWGTLWFLFPIPFSLESRLLSHLNHLATQLASKILDVIPVSHLAEGSTLSFANHSFQADQGLIGPIGLMAVGAVLAAWRGRPLFHSFALVLSGLLWSFFLSVARLGILFVGLGKFGFSLESSLLLSVGLALLAILAMLSTDFFFEYLMAPIPDSAMTPERSPITRVWHWLTIWPWPRMLALDSGQTPQHRVSALPKGLIQLAMILGMVQLAIAAYDWRYWTNNPHLSSEHPLTSGSIDTPPGWEAVEVVKGFQTDFRSPPLIRKYFRSEENFPARFSLWRHEGKPRQPFRPFTDFGWRIQEMMEGPEGTIITMSLDITGKWGCLLFASQTTYPEHKLVQPAPFKLGAHRSPRPPYAAELWAESPRPWTQTELDSLKRAFAGLTANRNT